MGKGGRLLHSLFYLVGLPQRVQELLKARRAKGLANVPLSKERFGHASRDNGSRSC